MNRRAADAAAGLACNRSGMPCSAAARDEVRRVYETFVTLQSCGAVPDTAFDQLLGAASGHVAARRLAARLLPRYVDKFPARLERAVDALLDLAAVDVQQVVWPERAQLVADAARFDAVRGITTCCALAASAGPLSPLVVARIVGVLFGRLQPFDVPEGSWVWRILETVFQTYPQALLGCCLQALRGSDARLFGACRAFLERLARAPEGEDHLSLPAVSLAAQVLTPLPDVQQWLRQSVHAFRKGVLGPYILCTGAAEVSPSKGREAHELLLRLLQQLPGAAVTREVQPTAKQPPRKRPRGVIRPEAGEPTGERGAGARPLALSVGTVAGSGGDAVHYIKANVDDQAAHVNSPTARHRLAGRHQPSREPAKQSFVELQHSRSRSPAGRRDRLSGPKEVVGPASRSLWVSGVPPHVSDPVLRSECSKHGGVVEHVTFPPCPGRDEAVLTFASIRDAALCLEGLSGKPVWGAVPLKVRFCAREAIADASSRSPADESNVHVWVGGISSSAGEDEVMKALTEANVPPPNGVLRVAGCTPGLLLQFAMADSVLLAVDALRLTKAERPSSHLLAGTHVQDAGRTLWVGQIGPVVREEDVLNAFSRFGELRGWKFLRQSHCAFIDFVSTPAAEEAKHILDGARFSGCNIRVELKDDKSREKLSHEREQATRESSARPKRSRASRSTSPANDPRRHGNSRHKKRSESRAKGRSETGLRAPRSPGEALEAGELPSGFPGSPRALPLHAITPLYQRGGRGAAIESGVHAKAPVVDGVTGTCNTIACAPVAPEVNIAPLPAWSGRLSKSGVAVCEVVCYDSVDANQSVDFPASLDVAMRADMSYVLDILCSRLDDQKDIRRLEPGPLESDRCAFVRFMQYLGDRRRAGVVNLDGLTVYLIPPSSLVCEALAVHWDGQTACLLAIIISSEEHK